MTGSDGNGTGSGGTEWDSNNGTISFPSVPYNESDFNCCHCSKCLTASCTIEDYRNINQVKNCRLVRLLDLNLGKASVREKVVSYLNGLLAIGVTGFRVDACKHMWPYDLQQVYTKLHHLRLDVFGSGKKPLIIQEVIDLGGEPVNSSQYTSLGKVTEFKYGKFLGEVFRGKSKLKDLKKLGTSSAGMMASHDALVFIDNHDNQRGHGAGGKVTLTFYDARLYKVAVAFMLAHPYGQPRIMSSYRWEGGPFSNDWKGPPANNNGDINNVPINNNGTCGGGWICEHRWEEISNMVAFHNTVHGTKLENWWDNGNNQIAFSRGNKGFIAINNGDTWMKEHLFTGLPPGGYCDVISGSRSSTGGCTGRIVYVSDCNEATFYIPKDDEHPMIAIHTGKESPNRTLFTLLKSARLFFFHLNFKN